MSTMMESVQHDNAGQSSVSQISSNAQSYRIKRAGARPLSFNGSELAMAMSYTPAIPYWYEINVYRTTDQRYVATVRLFYQSEDEQDTVRAWDFDALEQALDALAQYDAAHDVRITMDPADNSAPAAELAAYALELRSQVLAARRHYDSLIGEFFYELETGSQ